MLSDIGSASIKKRRVFHEIAEYMSGAFKQEKPLPLINEKEGLFPKKHKNFDIAVKF